MPYKLVALSVCLEMGEETPERHPRGKCTIASELSAEATGPTIRYRVTIEALLHRRNIYMSLRNCFPGLKKLKRRPRGRRQELEGGGTDSQEPIDLTMQPQSHVTVEGGHGCSQSGNGTDPGGGPVGPANPPPRSGDLGFVAVSGSGHDKGGQEVAIKGRGASGEDSHPGVDVEHPVESCKPSQGGNNVDGEQVGSPPPAALTLHPQGSKGMQTIHHLSHPL